MLRSADRLIIDSRFQAALSGELLVSNRSLHLSSVADIAIESFVSARRTQRGEVGVVHYRYTLPWAAGIVATIGCRETHNEQEQLHSMTLRDTHRPPFVVTDGFTDPSGAYGITFGQSDIVDTWLPLDGNIQQLAVARSAVAKLAGQYLHQHVVCQN